MSDDIPQIIKDRRKFHAEWCALMGLPAPRLWTEEDEARYQAKTADDTRRAREFWAAQRSEAA
ncbi:hypothetical protein [Actinoplanes sp. NPDC020271]|uniref:hypothetical protein n=1 Tax=Actinoplanes sp. NPDC020271 TaxID=3363896 RepID=UPI0037B08FFF